MLDHDEVVRLYGPWARRTPQDAAALLAGYRGRWWVAGGWAIDAFVGTSRPHGDLDLGIPRESLDEFVAFVSPRLDAWAAAGSLTPLVPAVERRSLEQVGNLWLRASGRDPWEYDVLLEAVGGDLWEYKRDRRITRPLADCLWSRDGVTYLRPEVQLLLKAKHVRPQDGVDFDRCLPVLDHDSRAWLAHALKAVHPDHEWIRRLS